MAFDTRWRLVNFPFKKKEKPEIFDQKLFNLVFSNYKYDEGSKQEKVKGFMKNLIKDIIIYSKNKYLEEKYEKLNAVLICGKPGVGKSLILKKSLQFLRIYGLDNYINPIEEFNILVEDKLDLDYISEICIKLKNNVKVLPIFTFNIESKDIFSKIKNLTIDDLLTYCKNHKVYKSEIEGVKEGFCILKKLFNENRSNLEVFEFDEKDKSYRKGGYLEKSEFKTKFIDITMFGTDEDEGHIFVGPEDMLDLECRKVKTYRKITSLSNFINYAEEIKEFTKNEINKKTRWGDGFRPEKKLAIISEDVFLEFCNISSSKDPEEFKFEKLVQTIKNIIDIKNSVYIIAKDDKCKNIENSINGINKCLKTLSEKNAKYKGHASRFENAYYCK